VAVQLAHGIPVSIYQDRHSCLKRNDPHWTLEEQVRGRQDPTWARSLRPSTRHRVAISILVVHSP
jgi:hypothetical protein